MILPTLVAILLAQTGETPAPFERLEVAPSSISLEGPRDRQMLVIRGIDAGGVTQDLSADATITVAQGAPVRLEGPLVIGVSDGECVITVSAAGKTVTVPVKSARISEKDAPIAFSLDVMPIFAKSRCNNGSCHGSARGQDGFHLSLFGFDPASDHHAITRELPGRRVNLAAPEESLLVRKAIGGVSHTGGKLFGTDDPRYGTLVRWLREGAKPDAPDAARLRGIELYPSELVLREGARQRMGVRATYSDGTDRDVTALTTFLSSNDYSVKAGDDGTISAARPGEAQILARYGAFAVGSAVVVLRADAGEASELGSGANYVDTAINEKLRRMRIAPSELATDEEFLRRATLDLTGLTPTAQERTAFLADTSADKRAKLIDELMRRKEFTEIWVMKWSERLGIRSNNDVSPKATLLYATWLQGKIAAGAPIDAIVRDIIGASGGTFDSPATNFYQLETDPLKLTENAAQAFLGTRIQCAQCHNHPFDRWTMDDYYGFAAFFAQIGRKPGEDPRETIVFNSGGGETKHPVGGRPVAPRFLGGAAPDTAGKDRRAVLAEWLTSRDNRMFARNVANFVWAHFFHRGIVEPVDDVRVSNPAANDALLDALAAKLIEYDYDFRPLVRDICGSHAYQRSTRVNATNEHDDRNFSHAQLRRIRAEFLLDSISRITATRDKFQGLPLGARAVQIADGTTSNYFLSTFGRAKRNTVCTCEVVMEPSLSQALHLINGENVGEKIKQGGVIKAMLDQGRTPDEVLDHLYASCLCRAPSAEERASILAPIGAGVDRQIVLEDAFWALLNSREFIFTH